MKRIIFICLLLVVTLPTWSSAAAIGPARIRLVDGDTRFRTPDSDEWLSATVNTPLDEGDAVWCPDGSRTEIQLQDGTIVRLDGGSQLDLIANEDGFTHLHLGSGRMYLRTAQNTRNDSLQIDADDTTVLPSARTRLRIDMLPDGQEDVAITKGSAYVEGNGSRTSVRAGEQITLEGGHNEILPLNPPDRWERWNVDRDRLQSRSARADSYLPDELHGYAAELDTHGTWVRVPEYGVVWRPTVIISDDWAPYRSGRWIWKGDDYVWLSFETWGWAPYHYGRWAVIGGFGWCWVPPVRGDVYWGPGYVGWYRTGSQVGWTPLAPGEIFYARRSYGRLSVNITNVNVNTSSIVYRNRNNRGGLTVLQQNDFLRGRSTTGQPARNSSVSVEVSVGSPRIPPLRETRMPIVKQAPPRVTPPRIEQRDTRELRNKFPRVIPQPAAQLRRTQPDPAVTTQPAAPSSRTPQLRDKQVTHPAALPPEHTTTPAKQPPQQLRDRQTTQPAALPPERATTPDKQPQLPAAQQREEPRQRSTPPQAGAAHRADQPRRVSVPREMKQRKVWKVTTPENGKEKDDRGKERKER